MQTDDRKRIKLFKIDIRLIPSVRKWNFFFYTFVLMRSARMSLKYNSFLVLFRLIWYSDSARSLFSLLNVNTSREIKGFFCDERKWGGIEKKIFESGVDLLIGWEMSWIFQWMEKWIYPGFMASLFWVWLYCTRPEA